MLSSEVLVERDQFGKGLECVCVCMYRFACVRTLDLSLTLAHTVSGCFYCSLTLPLYVHSQIPDTSQMQSYQWSSINSFHACILFHIYIWTVQVKAREQSRNGQSNRCNLTAELQLQQFLAHSSSCANLCHLLESFKAADKEMQ